MKKYIFAGIAAALLATSCSNEDVVAPSTGGNVVFTAELPTLGSRAYGDGTTASSLTAYVYSAEEGETPTFLFSKKADFAGELKTTVQLDLVTGKTYDIVFWTQASGAPYTYSTDDRTITVNYEGATANDETRDAFYFTEKGLKITGPVQKTVSLRRPFAQLNVLTSDYASVTASGVEVTKSSLTMTLPKTLDLATGAVSGEDEVSYALADIPVSDDIVIEQSGKTYKYLSMNYILADADKAVVDVKIGTDFELNNELAFTAVPVQRNYRTNIFGALLTNPAVFDVEILPDFDGMNNIDKDKEIAPGVEFDEATKTYKLYTKDALLWFNDQTNTAKNQFSGCTVILVSDVDLNRVKWTPIAKGSAFLGVFDGGNNTISNLTTTDPDCAGFFWSARNVKNLTLKNVKISGNFKAGAISGDGLCSTFDNCHVDGGTIVSTPREVNGVMDDGNNVGGITGYLSAEPNASITNCSVKNVTLKAFRTIGGLVGKMQGASCNVKGNTVENVEIIANMTTPGYPTPSRGAEAGEICNSLIGGASLNAADNTTTDVTVTIIGPNNEGNIEIADAKALGVLSDIIIGGETFEGKTIVLTQDIALDPTVSFEPLGKFQMGSSTAFKGTFDGQGHTISDLYIETTASKKSVGLFGHVQNATIKNLTLKNPTVKGAAYAGALVGLAYKGNGYTTIENVTVDGATVISVPQKFLFSYDGGNNVGGLIGITQFGIVLKGCTVKNSTVTGYEKVGGMVGLACYVPGSTLTSGNVTIYENNTVENVTVNQSLENAYQTTVPTTIGAFGGMETNTAIPSETYTLTNVTVNPAE